MSPFGMNGPCAIKARRREERERRAAATASFLKKGHPTKQNKNKEKSNKCSKGKKNQQGGIGGCKYKKNNTQDSNVVPHRSTN